MEIKKLMEIWQTVESESGDCSPFFASKKKAILYAKINSWKSYYIYKRDLFE